MEYLLPQNMPEKPKLQEQTNMYEENRKLFQAPEELIKKHRHSLQRKSISQV